MTTHEAAPAARSPWYSRTAVHDFVWSKVVQQVVITVILVNAVVLGLQTSPQITEHAADALALVDDLCVVVYIVEIALKLYADRARFFRSGWNIFDFVIVSTTLIPGGSTFAVLRALRVLRVLRLVSVAPSLRRVVDGLGRSIPGIVSVAALLAILFYVAAVMSTTLFGAQFPEMFGSLESSLFTLFQLMTLDDWANITRDVSAEYPLAPIFFVLFVSVSALTVLNLVVAVIVDAMQQFDGKPDATSELAALRTQIDELTTLVRAQQEDGSPPPSSS